MIRVLYRVFRLLRRIIDNFIFFFWTWFNWIYRRFGTGFFSIVFTLDYYRFWLLRRHTSWWQISSRFRLGLLCLRTPYHRFRFWGHRRRFYFFLKARKRYNDVKVSLFGSEIFPQRNFIFRRNTEFFTPTFILQIEPLVLDSIQRLLNCFSLEKLWQDFSSTDSLV